MQGRKTPAKRRSSPAPKRKSSSPRRRSRSPAPLERSDSKTSFQWREELESLVTVFASRREVHEVLKNVACIMMALAAIPILTHFAGGDVHNCQDPGLLRGAFVLVLSIRLCALSTLLLAIRFYASCSQKWALGFLIAASLAPDILNQHVAVVLLVAGFTLRLALSSAIQLCASQSHKDWVPVLFIYAASIAPEFLSPHVAVLLLVSGLALYLAVIFFQPEVLVRVPAGTKHYGHTNRMMAGCNLHFPGVLVAHEVQSNRPTHQRVVRERQKNLEGVIDFFHISCLVSICTVMLQLSLLPSTHLLTLAFAAHTLHNTAVCCEHERAQKRFRSMNRPGSKPTCLVMLTLMGTPVSRKTGAS